MGSTRPAVNTSRLDLPALHLLPCWVVSFARSAALARVGLDLRDRTTAARIFCSELAHRYSSIDAMPRRSSPSVPRTASVTSTTSTYVAIV